MPAPSAVLQSRAVASLVKVESKPAQAQLLPQIAKAPASRDLAREMESLAGKLNDAARDLVEAIEGSLPKDLEMSYKKGEGHVYIRKLYLARAGRLPRVVAERYGSERLVRGRVDSFVRLFERLLDGASESPQGDALVDACLASEAGKIYLLLAQTIGRIGTPAKA